MTQYVFPNLVSPTSGSLLRATLTNWHNAEISNNSGNIAPASPVLGSKWMDTSAYPVISLKIYDGAQWITVSSVDASAHTALAGGLNQFDETDILLGGFIYYDADLKRHRYWTHGKRWTYATLNSANFSGESIVTGGKLYTISRLLAQTKYRENLTDALETTLSWNNPIPTPVYGYTTAYFDSKFWIIGGSDNDGTNYDTVYSSANGQDWTLVTDSPGWSARRNAIVLEFDSKLWVIGGNDFVGSTVTFFSDAWYSSDGATWTRSASTISYDLQSTEHGFVWDNKLWIADSRAYVTKFLYSSDGATWTAVAQNASTPRGYNYNWDQRDIMGLVKYDGWIYFCGRDRLWRTKNMVDWISGNTSTDTEKSFKAFSFDNQLIAVGDGRIYKAR